VFIFAFLFIAAIFFVRDEILSKRAKIIATALIVLLCAGAYLYESASERSAKLEEEMVFKFNAGARLRCGGAINSASETRGAANSSPEKYGEDAKNLGSQAGEANLKEQGKAAFAAQSSAAQTNEQASAAQINGTVSGGQNSAQSPTSQNSTQQNDTQNRAAQNSTQSSAQIVTRESFTYSFSLGAFIAKKSAGSEFKGKTYKIKECVYDQ